MAELTSPQREDAHAELAALRQTNTERYGRLVSRPLPDGRRAIPDPLGVLAVRLNCLLEVLFSDPDSRLRYDLVFEQAMTQVLDACERQASASALLVPEGVNLSNPRNQG